MSMHVNAGAGIWDRGSGRRPATPRFGAASGLDPQTLIAGIGNELAQAEDALKEARKALVYTGQAMRELGMGPLPGDVVDAFHKQRRQVAERLVAFVTRLQEYGGSVPFVGDSIKAQLVAKLGNPYGWADAFYARVPALPAGLVPSPRVGFNPDGFGNPAFAIAVANPLAAGIVIIASAVFVGVVAYGAVSIIESFNDAAVAAKAQAELTRATTAAQAQGLAALKAAGASAKQVADYLLKTKPEIPDTGMGLGTVLKYGAIAAGGIGVLYLLLPFIAAARRKA